jgi:cytochrome c biogenesis protein CcdA/thioredoxin-related protein
MRSRPKLKLLFLLSLFITLSATSQDSTAIKDWKVESKRVTDRQYQLTFKVTIGHDWQFYAPNQVLLDVKTMDILFADSAIRVDTGYQLISKPVTITSAIFDGQSINILEREAVWNINIFFSNDSIPARLPGTLYYTYGRGDEFYPSNPHSFVVELEGGIEAWSIKRSSIDITNPVVPCGDDGTKGKSLLAIFLLGLLGGLIALITPCVFPMIPVTVTFFTKKSQDRRQGIRNAILYGLFIFLIYVLITMPFHIAGKTISPEIFNNISTNVWLNILFFAIFVFFALSFFGLFELGLPSGLANKIDSRSGLGNIGGIFFMAATLAIVSFSCTGPILGTLLVGVAEQGALPLTVGAAGFGLALGLPFALFAMFPNWLHSLPKSGGWMTDVKVVLGFLELALADKFLSNADLVKQWGLLKREIFIGLWILFSLLTVLYLLGILKLKHSSPVKRYSFVRLFFIVTYAAITIYLIPGLFKNPWSDLKLISGFPPPRTYSIYDIERADIIEPLHNDYLGALQQAKRENKPLLIDFTGWACVNCRRMEDKAWPDKEVDSLMRNHFIVLSLYVDERKKLPVQEQTVVTLSNGTEKSIVTVGDKWSTFQIENFGATSQPQYAIISPGEKVLTKTKYYTPDPAAFASWLKCGLEAHRNTSSQ